MNRATILATALIAFCGFINTTGCATVKIVPASQLHGQELTGGSAPVAHIYADNWGIYLFKYIPIITGNMNPPSWIWPITLFNHNVRVDVLVERVTEEAQQRGGTLLTDLRTRDRSYWLSWTLIFWLNEFEISANSSAPPLSDNQPKLPAHGGE
jgi:hypothetical protein